MTRTVLMLAVAGVLALTAAARADERAELKERFRERHPTLVALKRAEKVGETHRGLAAVVRPEHAGDAARGGQTVAAFLEEENRDRRRLYELLAAETGATPEAVAARDAKRRFEAARPAEFLSPREGVWVRKRDLPGGG